MTPDAAPPKDVEKQSRWQQLAPEKKFALITLLSLGSALLVTGELGFPNLSDCPRGHFDGSACGQVTDRLAFAP